MTEVIYWSGWIGGLAIGLYAMLQQFVINKPLGVSSGFGNVCGIISKNEFFHTDKFEDPFNWRLWFIIGIPLGGLIAALTSPGDIVASFSLGTLYDSVLPSELWLRGPILLAGGTAMGLGARFAGGCTSGHAISGIGLLNPPSIIASAGFFVGGIAIVQLLFNVL